jgi:hypothetical protein
MCDYGLYTKLFGVTAFPSDEALEKFQLAKKVEQALSITDVQRSFIYPLTDQITEDSFS